ncbi:MAG: pilus assembly protein PilZ [Pseudomonadota bacterium]
MVDPHDFSPTPPERRDTGRAHVAIEADLRKVGRTSFKVLVTDLSRTGCHADTLSKTYVDDRVWITLPGFAPIEATIRRSDHSGFGAEWHSPMHESVFDHIKVRFPDMFH